MPARLKSRTNGFSYDEEDPVFVWPGMPDRVPRVSGVRGWKCDLLKQRWYRVKLNRRGEWIPTGPEIQPYGFPSGSARDIYDD